MHQIEVEILRGHRLRMTIPPASGKDDNSPPLHLFGAVVAADPLEVRAQLETLPPSNLETGWVEFEILHPDGLIRFQSTASFGGENGTYVVVPMAGATGFEWVQRRRHIRVPVALAVRFWPYPLLDDSKPWNGTVSNLAAGGLAAIVPALQSVGSRLLLELPGIPGLVPQPVLTEVVRIVPGPTGSAEQTIGLRFVDISAAQEAAVAEYVRIQSVRQAGNLPG